MIKKILLYGSLGLIALSHIYLLFVELANEQMYIVHNIAMIVLVILHIIGMMMKGE